MLTQIKLERKQEEIKSDSRVELQLPPREQDVL